MKIYATIQDLIAEHPKVVLAFGNFDGVHLGHQKILQKMQEFAQKESCVAAIFSFSPHPRKVLQNEKNLKLLTSDLHRFLLFENYGISNLINYNFTKETAEISPKDFIENFLNFPSIDAIFVGKNWRFGKNGVGSVEYLKKKKINVIAVEEVFINETKISSSQIRKFIEIGDLQNAKKFLGHNFSVYGQVIHGLKIAGKILNFPTANINYENEIVPPSGVYAGRMILENSTNEKLPGIINVGNIEPAKVEFHAFGFNENIYSRFAEIEFVAKIREEKRFSSQKELITEIGKNIVIAKQILG